MGRRRNPWIGIGFSTWALGVEASSVIALRTLKIAQGGSVGAAEAERMVQEKMDAAAELQQLALTGGLGLTPTTTRKEDTRPLSPQGPGEPATPFRASERS